MSYLSNLGIAISQLANAVIGGDPDESISSRCGKQLPRCRLCRALCAVLNLIDRNHCRDAIEPDEGNPFSGK